jgi:peptidyl-prolyl cis-trans isomerase C
MKPLNPAKMNMLSFLSFVVIILASGCSQKEKTIVAVVNGTNIKIEEFKNEMATYRLGKTSLESPQGALKYLEIKKAVLDSMIRERLLLDEADKSDIAVNEEEVSNKISSFKSDYPGDTLRQYLTQNGINYNYWKEKLKRSLIVSKLTESVTKDVTSINETDITDYYAKHTEGFSVPEQIHAFQIVVKTEEEAYKILDQIRQGKSFEELAKTFSITPEGKDGGNLGYFSKGSMPPAFDNVLFTMPQGKISKVVSSEYGYHIFKVADKKPAYTKELKDVRDSIISLLKREKKDDIFAEWFKGKIAKAKIIRNNSLLANLK